MSKVSVSGLPTNISCSAISLCFAKILTKVGVRKFWVRELSYDNNSKLATIEFVSHYEASKAKDRLNNLFFDFNGQKFPLTAYIEESRRPKSPSNHRRRPPSPFEDSYGGYAGNTQSFYDEERNWSKHYVERERSPLRYNKETSKLDMEIELLRKQRLVIEEERRLLMATKKLELVREYGPSAAEELAEIEHRGRDLAYDNKRDRDTWRAGEREREMRRPEKRPRLENRPFRPAPQKQLNRPHFTPLFVLPCKILLKSISDRRTFGSNERETKILFSQVRNTLRKRIAVALEGKPRMATADIVKLYRKLYPEKTDDDLVKRLLGKLRESAASEGEEQNVKETAVSGENEELLSDAGTSTAELTATSANGVAEEDLNTDGALSLDATEIESLNNGESEWNKGNDWWSEDANQAFTE